MLMGCNCGVNSLRGMRGLGDGLPMGAQCNTAGGYKLVQPKGYQTPQCMTDADLAAANAAYSTQGAAVPITGVVTNRDPTPGVTPTPGGVVSGVINSLPASLSTFDPIAFAKQNWMYLAGGAVVLLLVFKK